MLDIESVFIVTWQAYIATGISAAMILYLLPRRQTPGTRALVLLMTSVMIWSFGYGMELKAPTLADKLRWMRLEYLGAAWVGLMFYRFALVISGRHDWLSGPRHWGLFIVPGLTIAGVYTNDHHLLMWSRVWIETGGILPTLAYQRGPGFWCFVGFSYGLLLVATVVLFYRFQSSGKRERRNFRVLMIGLAAPWCSNALYLLRVAPLQHIDFTPFAFSISGAAFFWAVIRHQVLELIPIARDAVIESLHDAVFVLNLQGRVVDLNSTAKRLLPGRRRTYVGQHLIDLFPALAKHIDLEDPTEPPDAEVVFPMDGSDRHWLIRRSVLFGSIRTPSGWLITLHDVTEQRSSELALRESEEKFRSISAHALDGIIMIDPDGRVSFWNAAAEKIFGYRADEILGRDLHTQLAPERFRASYHRAFSDFQLTGTGRVLGRIVEIECLNKDGHVFPAELSVAPLKLNGRWHAVGIVRDISERKKTQEYLIHSEKMLSMGGLAAGMAHEINNPLAGILSNIQMIRMRLYDDLPANQQAAAACGLDLDRLRVYMQSRGILDMISASELSCQRAADIVRNMLDFSRRRDTVLSRHNLVQLLDRTVALADNDFKLKSHYDFRHIDIVHDHAPDVPDVLCDGNQIQQVLLNILKNGAQAMWEAPVAGRAPRFVLRVYREAAYACIAVSDNGPGIGEEIRKRIFEPFYTTKPIGSGTGLGLSIAYFIVVEKHSGRLEVEAAAGGGTTFIVKLPIARDDDGRPAAAESATAITLETAGGGKRDP